MIRDYHPLSILPRVLLKRNAAFVFQSALLPRCELSTEQLITGCSEKRISRFHQAVAWQGEGIHPCFLHTLAFRQHLQLMLQPAFPFAVLGLVHKANKIAQFAALSSAPEGLLSSQVCSFKRHDRGISFVISSRFECNNDLVWRSESEFIAIDKLTMSAIKATPINLSADPAKHSQHQNWQLNADLGRQYAAASGDFNPIHLSALSAKLFGFKRAIAHGMWTKARCLSALSQHSASAFRCEVEFKRPLFLPNQVTFSNYIVDEHSLALWVTSDDHQQLHLQGRLVF
ncbi:MaoC family dehydratase [Aliiglaciecola litoralis]|uniref:MaoC/PaaZ C-terminal domain-containing protein n=1 Tax=Aliiglaciecola litoralis TaxID=582857 RepID=A0ABN1LJW6_9ALTE